MPIMLCSSSVMQVDERFDIYHQLQQYTSNLTIPPAQFDLVVTIDVESNQETQHCFF